MVDKARRMAWGDVENNLQKTREEQVLSKAELARLSGLSVLTIDRIERFFPSRPCTRRKLLQALGIDLGERKKVFPKDP